MQQSFERMAAYLNGSTVNVTFGRKPRRYTGAYATDQFLLDPRRRADDGPRLHAGGQSAGRGESGAASPTASGSATSAGPATSSAQRCGSTASRRRSSASCRRASPFRSTRRSGCRCSASFRRGRATIRRELARRCSALLKPGVTIDQATPEFTTLARRFAAAYPDTNKQFNTGQVQRLIDNFTPPVAARHAADDAGVLRRRAADRVRQRHEHAVRARDAARQGAGDSIVARRDRAAA